MERDRAKHNVLPLSKFGLMQITRQRVRPAVEVEVMETCPTCMGKGKIQPSILFTDQIAEICEHMAEHYGRGLRLHLHPFVYAYVCRGLLFTSLKWQWKRQFGVRIVENQSLGMLEMRFYDSKGNVISHRHEEPKPQEQPKKAQEQPKKVEQPQKVEEPKKPQEQPKQVEQPKKTEQPKAKAPKKAKAEQPKQEEVKSKQEETKPKAKRARKAAKPKEAPVAPAEKSPAETKAPTAVKKRSHRKKSSNEESNKKESH
jgi:hypothetical protein